MTTPSSKTQNAGKKPSSKTPKAAPAAAKVLKTAALKAETIDRVADLEPGQTLLNSVRKINGDKYQFEFITRVAKSSEPSRNLLAAANIGDDRFKDTSVFTRYTYFSATLEGAAAVLDIDVSDVDFEYSDLNILDPKHANGEDLTTEIRESSEATMSPELRAKRVKSSNWLKTDKGVQIYAADGGKVYRQSIIVCGTPKHVFIEKMAFNSSAVVAKATRASFGEQNDEA